MYLFAALLDSIMAVETIMFIMVNPLLGIILIKTPITSVYLFSFIILTCFFKIACTLLRKGTEVAGVRENQLVSSVL